jgi:hypothetical protein
MKEVNNLKACIIIILIGFTFSSNNLHAQLPGTGIFFQAVARDNASNAAKDRKIYVQSNIIQYTATGKSVLMEEFETKTDATGVFSISLGLGKKLGGTASTLQNIVWSEGPYFLNLKISITPIAPVANWDYVKDLIDLGTTPFGTVPYALYAGSAFGLNEKLNTADTSAMLNAYVKNQVIKNLEDAVTSKISSADTSAMLAPYKKIVNELVASNIASLTAASINEALISKVNLVDSGLIYVTPAQLAAKTFDLAPINNNIAKKLNITDTGLMLSARFARDTIALSNRINSKANSADITTSLALKVNVTDVTASLNLKENLNNKSVDINNIGDVNDEKYPSVKAIKTYVDAAVASVGGSSAASFVDADATTKGKIKLAGDLTGTADAPTLSSNAVTTSKINDGAITDAKVSTGISATKVGLGNVNNTSDALKPVSIATQIAMDLKLGIADTTNMLSSYLTSLIQLNNNKLNSSDTASMLTSRIRKDTAFLLQKNDTIYLSNRILTKENSENKSIDITNINDINDVKYPTVKAVKTYVDATVSSVLVADGSITTQKLANDAVTDSKVAPGISASKVGLGYVTNNAQIYSLNGLTNQVQTFGIGSLGTSPAFSSSTATHTLHIPMASSTSVTAGLLSNTDWNTFNSKLSSFTETDPSVSVINGIVKSDGSFISAANAGTDYLSPTGSAMNLTNFPTLNQNTTGSAASLTNAYINWNANTGGASILNKPTLFSGAYADLSGLPILTSGTVTSVAALTIGTTGTDITSSVANETTTPTITLNIPTASITNRGLLSATDWSTFNSKGDMTLTGVQTVTGSKTFSNTIVGSINGNAATATKLATPVTINGTSFDGSANISFSTNTANALTYNNGGAGDASGNSFNGSAAKTISYNSIGAAPTIGSSSITTLGTIATGTWNASTITVAKGGTGATTLTANGVIVGNGTSAVSTVAPSTNGNVLTSNGTSWISSTPSVTLIREVANEFSATTSQTSFTLTQTPSVNSKVKMYINGVRISNSAYSISGTTLTYNATNNSDYSLTASDRIQFDYYY